MLKFSTCFQHSFQHSLQISICVEIFNMLFQHSKVFCSMHIMQELHTNRPNFQHTFQHALQISTHAEIFNMLFQHSKVFHSIQIMQELHTNIPNCQHSFQHALQISTCAEIFNMLFQDVFNTFQTWNSPMVWTMLETVLKTMSNISKCIENYVEIFKACWKPYRKFQSVSKITMTWLLCDPFHQFWNIKAVIKIKSDIINEDYRPLWCYMWSVIEILCGLEEKIGPAYM